MRSALFVVLLFLINSCGQQQTMPPSSTPAALEFPAIAKGKAPALNPKGHLSLLKALSLTLYHNPSLKVFGQNLRLSQIESLKASVRNNPQIGLEVEDVLGSGDRKWMRSAQATLTLSHTFELGGKRSRRMAAAHASSESLQLDFQVRRRDVMEAMTVQYIQVIFLEHQVAIERQMAALDTKIYNVFNAKVQGDQLSPLQLARFEVEMGLRRAEREQRISALRSAKMKLAGFWGEGKALFTSVDTCFYRKNKLKPLDKLSMALAMNPRRRYFAALQRLRDAQLQVARSLNTPDITVSAGVRYYQDTTSGGGVLGVSIPIPVWEASPGAVREVLYNKDRDSLKAKLVANQLQIRLNHYYRQLVFSQKQATAFAKVHLPHAISTYEKINEGFTLGKLSYLEVLNAKTTVHRVHLKYHELLRDYAQAFLAISYLTGQDPGVEKSGTIAHCL